jgi:predicted phosphodiesterase
VVASVAVLSDVHGVLPVLTAVLAEPAVLDAELIVVTGDHASGPQPTAVLDCLIALGPRAVLISGNADRELVSIVRGDPIDIPDDVTPWAAEQLSPTHVDLLAGLPQTVTIEIDGFGPVLFCHATPRNDTEIVLVDSSLERWAEVLSPVPADVRTIVCGHTHMPYTRLVDRRLVVNPGSIGMPYGRPGGHWALLHGGSVTLHRVNLDVNAVITGVVANSTFPGREEWANYFLRATPSDAEALRLFGPKTPTTHD